MHHYFRVMEMVVPRIMVPAAVCTLEPIIKYRTGGSFMEKWVCTVCDYVYDPAAGDPDNGVEPGTPRELPDDWVCPVCGVGRICLEQE